MRSFATLLRAELLQLRTTPLPGGLLIALLTAAAVVSVESAVAEAGDFRGGERLRELLGQGAAAGVAWALPLGVLGAAGARAAILEAAIIASPRRSAVFSARLLIGALAGALLGTFVAAAAIGVALPWMEARDSPFPATDAAPLDVLGAAPAAGALLAVIGVGLGALVPRPLALSTAAVAVIIAALAVAAPPDALLDPVWGAGLAGAAVVVWASGLLAFGRRDLT